MICDSLKHAQQYASLQKGFDAAFRYLAALDAHNMPAAGTYEIDGDDVYASVQYYETMPDEQLQWEAHRCYIDIQYLCSGREALGWADVAGLNPFEPYQAQKDVVTGSLENGSLLNLEAGQFAVFFPQDAHKPRCISVQSESVIKVVVKVKV